MPCYKNPVLGLLRNVFYSMPSLLQPCQSYRSVLPSYHSRIFPSLHLSTRGTPAELKYDGYKRPIPRLFDIAVVGGGACGIAVLMQIIQKAQPGLRVALIEKSPSVGLGLHIPKHAPVRTSTWLPIQWD